MSTAWRGVLYYPRARKGIGEYPVTYHDKHYKYVRALVAYTRLRLYLRGQGTAHPSHADCGKLHKKSARSLALTESQYRTVSWFLLSAVKSHQAA